MSANKSQTNSQNDPVKAAMNNPCPTCRNMGVPPPCKGHAKGGSGGGDGGGSDPTSKTDNDTRSTNTTPTDQLMQASTYTRSDTETKTLNPHVLSELLILQLLVITNDKDSGILTIKLQYDPASLSSTQKAELKKLIDSILKELNEFKKENNIKDNCATLKKDREGNVIFLQIALPKPTLYDAFIRRLESKKLLPSQGTKQANAIDKKDEKKSKTIHRSPFSIDGPKPKSYK